MLVPMASIFRPRYPVYGGPRPDIVAAHQYQVNALTFPIVLSYSPRQPRWLCQTGTRTPLIRMPR
jgi:hypothetical protein